ncbi:histidine kinase-like ATPase [Hypoxylon argillaceum]|nr:histidine kinase-like ATPase [Hypoxylon argillaceum]
MSCSSISRLPDSATRLLSSHMVVVTPLQLVKELLDNAIDAKATSIEILVSPNTISRVEVRDDGVGIHPDDYDALGRRGHTSKLKDIEELGCLVGKTLGFRGEALASANSMADITITTKISTEPVAAVLQLIPNEGGVLTQKSISSPVGTTVNVTNLFGRQPVREQIAIKEAKKTLGKIQELLRSYAMARPQLKLLFKVLQTSTNTCDFVLEAIFINPNTDPQKVPRGHYFSVDGRPINAGRGITKRLLNIYVEHLKLSTLAKSTSDYFIRLDICCPPGTYDANIEPSKDNVLFSDEHVILDGFRRLCSEIYRPATSSLMPLENTPPEYSTHGFSLTASISSSVIDELVQLFRKYDDYAIYGTLVDGLDMSLADGRAVESQLQRLLTEHKENIGNGDGQIITGLQAALKGKGVEVAPTA